MSSILGTSVASTIIQERKTGNRGNQKGTCGLWGGGGRNRLGHPTNEENEQRKTGESESKNTNKQGWGNKRTCGWAWCDVHRWGRRVQDAADVHDRSIGGRGGSSEGIGRFICPVSRAYRVRASVSASLPHSVFPPRGRPRLRVSRTGHCARVCVSDTHIVLDAQRNKSRTDLRISSFITAPMSASISSSSLETSRATYELRSFPKIFQISEPSALSGSDARRFGGGGETESEGDRGRFLGGIPPERGGTPPPPDTDPDLA